MPTVGETSRPGYVYDSATDVWIPVGIGPHSHTPAAIGAISSSVVTTKGDLIVATGSGVVTRQGVGADGSYLVADSTQADGVNWSGPSNTAGKNAVLNSNFSVWQRGTSGTANSFSAGAGYNADRWQNYSVNALTVSRQVTGDTTNLPFIQYCARVQRNSGQTSTNAMTMGQSIETVNSVNYAGKPITFTFYARAGANFSSASNALSATLYSGTGTDGNILTGFTGSASVATGTATLTTTWQRFTFTGTVASTATQLGIYLAYTPVGTAGANDWYEITGVQLEVGSVATPYAPNGATYQAELAACQRYYYRSTSGNAFGSFGVSAIGSSATIIRGVLPTPVSLRVSPTAIDFSTLCYLTNFGGSVTAITNATIYATCVSLTAPVIEFTTTGGATNTYYQVIANNSATAYIGLSAEL